MSKLIPFLTLYICVAASACAQQASKTDSLVFTEFQSAVLKEKRRIVVHLPLSYTRDTTKHYPVMYVLDAGTLNFDVASRSFALSSAELAPESIVVGILNAKGARERDLTPPFMQTEVDDPASPPGKGDVFLEFIESELIPKVDSAYRTSAVRSLTGHSRSGLFVLYTLIQKPELFQARFAYSTPAWRFDNVVIKKLEVALKEKGLTRKSYLFFSVGEKENANIVASFNVMNEMLKRVGNKNLVWSSYVSPGGNHQTNAVLSISRGLSLWKSK